MKNDESFVPIIGFFQLKNISVKHPWAALFAMNWPDQTVPLPISSALHLVFKLYHDKLKRIYDVVLCRMPEMHLTSLSKEYELFADYEYFLFQHDFYPTKIFKEFQLKLDPRNSFYMIALSNPFPKEIMTLLELFLAIPLLFAHDHLLLSKNVSSESLFFYLKTFRSQDSL